MRGKYGDKERIGHIIDCIAFIEKATACITSDEFENNLY